MKYNKSAGTDREKMESVKYFSRSGEQNTEKVLDMSFAKALKKNINNILIATTRGNTLIQAAEKRENNEEYKDIKLFGMTLQAGVWEEYSPPDWDKIEKAGKMDVKVITCTHALMGNIASSIKNKFGGLPPSELIAYTYYTFSHGTKVAVEISLNAVDAGIIPENERVIAIAGRNEGADTAILLKAVSTVNFFDLRINEFICKPK